jgi:hypothetical protein
MGIIDSEAEKKKKKKKKSAGPITDLTFLPNFWCAGVGRRFCRRAACVLEEGIVTKEWRGIYARRSSDACRQPHSLKGATVGVTPFYRHLQQYSNKAELDGHQEHIKHMLSSDGGTSGELYHKPRRVTGPSRCHGEALDIVRGATRRCG